MTREAVASGLWRPTVWSVIIFPLLPGDSFSFYQIVVAVMAVATAARWQLFALQFIACWVQHFFQQSWSLRESDRAHARSRATLALAVSLKHTRVQC